jgi:hypothetical protein
MALLFPPTPALNDVYPANPGTSGVTQYRWDGVKWMAALSTVSLGTANQDAFNGYQWPTTDGPAGYQLQTDGAGNLSWELEANGNLQAVGITPVIDGVSTTYTLVEFGTGTFFTPTPPTNIVVFLGGVPQTPTVAYTISGNQITFSDPPLAGTTFYAISATVVV